MTGRGADAGVVTPTARGLFRASGALAVISLGLPWGAPSAAVQLTMPYQALVPGPALSHASTAGAIGRTLLAPITDGGGTSTIGAQHPVRVLALVAAALMLVAVRQDSPGLARLAVLVAGSALPIGLTGGLGSGRVVFAAAVVLAAMASGVLPRPRRPGG